MHYLNLNENSQNRTKKLNCVVLDDTVFSILFYFWHSKVQNSFLYLSSTLVSVQWKKATSFTGQISRLDSKALVWLLTLLLIEGLS